MLVGVSYWLAFADAHPPSVPPSVPASPVPYAPAVDPEELASACRRAGDDLLARLSPGCQAVVEPPFVLAGDLTREQLRAHYRQTIVPTWRALTTCYFDRTPDRPVMIVLCANDASYQEHAVRLDGRQGAAYYGYYQRDSHRIVINVATGDGTLAHELTHALAQFDFAEMPEWFDEGLASLHEQSEINAAETEIHGLINWRLYYLKQAFHSGQLQSLHDLLRQGTVRSGLEAVDYAHARYFCLYLQQQGLLQPFYRKFREHAAEDPSGVHTLCELLRVESLDEVDRSFEAWAQGLDAREGLGDAGGATAAMSGGSLEAPSRGAFSTRVPE